MARTLSVLLGIGLLCLATTALAAELKVSDVTNAKGDGPDGKGNTSDDTWQFWFELAHRRGSFHLLDRHTDSVPKGGIKGKVTGPIGSKMPNPGETKGWIYHSDWDGRFEGIWGDAKAGHVIAYPYVEKKTHGAVAVSYKVPEAGKYKVTAKLTDLMVRPNFKAHDGFTWSVETAKGGDRIKQFGKGGPIGDGKGPESGTVDVEVEAQNGQLIRLIIHPRKWWGTDMTHIEALKIERVK